MKKLVQATVAVGLAMAAGLAMGQVVWTDGMKSQVDAAVSKALKDTDMPSAQVGIAVGGKVVFTCAYGLARIEPEAKATADLPYGIGSVSKQFTASAAMILMERGKLRLDDPVATWFPELAHSKEITLRMLLNQVSGYSDYYTEDYLTPELATPTDTLAQVKRWTSRPLDFPPGTKWQYSNTNYELAALIVQKVAGEPFFAFLTKNVLQPAGLKHVIDLGGEVPAVPQGYLHFGFGPPRATPREAKGTLFGAGQLAMPIGDLLLWDTVVMQRKVLKPTSWQVLQGEFNLPDGSGTGYGMGYFVEAKGGRRVIEHSGGLNGFTTLNQLYPTEDVAIGVLVNGDGGTGAIVRAVEGVVFAPTAKAPIVPDARADALTKAAVQQLAEGRIDRQLINENLAFFFTPQASADYKTSLVGFGNVKSVEAVNHFERGGMDGWFYKVTAEGGKAVGVFVYVTKDGKLDQLLLEKI